MAYQCEQEAGLNTPSPDGLRGDDAELIAAAVTINDAAAFGELVRRYQSQVRVFLLRLCRDPSRADDLAQDCFVTAWQKLSGFRGTGSFAGWLMRIAWTTFLQAKRKRDRYHEIVEQAATENALAQVIQASEDVTDLDRLLASLTEQERAVMILAYACGLSHREISESADLPVGTVKSIIFRTKEKLRKDFDLEDHQYG